MTHTSTFQCANCGSVLLAGERFCGRCGSPTGAPESPPTLIEGEVHSPWDSILRQLRASTLGEFEIKRELGRGGMAAVYLAHEIALNRKVALKVMAPGLMLGEGMVERFRFEAVTIANLTHPHIVRIHAVRQVAEMHFFVMQYLAGRSLERIVRTSGPLPIPLILIILSQVGGALGYAHRRGVIHRDIKPANILFDATGDAIVTDFGIAKVAEEPSQTLAGSVVGTPSYMSPEQCYAQHLSGASDQYSLGIVAFELLTGHAPFTGQAYSVMQGHTHGDIPSIRSLRPDCPSDLEAVVRRMLARKPEDRFASMGDAVKALGAPAPGEHDAVRDELMQLAAIEENAALDATVPTPLSPIPQSRNMRAQTAPAFGTTAASSGTDARAGASRAEHPVRSVTPAGDRTMLDASTLSEEHATNASTTAARTRPIYTRWQIVVPAVVAIAVAIFAVTRPDVQTPTIPDSATTPEARADSTTTPTPVTTNRTTVDSTALASPSPSPGSALPPRDRIAQSGAPGAQNAQVKPTVKDSVTIRTQLPAPVSPPVREPPARDPPVRAIDSTPPRPPDRPSKSAAELRNELDATIRAYAAAIESRDFGRLRSAFPAIPQSQLDAYQTFFDFARDVKITIARIDVTDALSATAGTEARARVDYTIQYRNNSTRRDVRESSQWQATLHRTASGWQLASLR